LPPPYHELYRYRFHLSTYLRLILQDYLKEQKQIKKRSGKTIGLILVISLCFSILSMPVPVMENMEITDE
ncbi:MAG: hypothetical protein RR234_10210, partial [Christensenella sp.]